MKNLASTAGWLLLAAVLAVPSFLFYNWWAKNKEKAAAERTQGTVTGAVFQPLASEGGRLNSQPMITPASAASAGGRSVMQPVTSSRPPAAEQYMAAKPLPAGLAQSTAAAVTTQSADADGTPISRPAALPAGGQPAQPGTATARVPVQGALSTATASGASAKPGSYYSPKSKRDPTISPLEYRQLKYEEYKRAEAERLELAAARKREREGGPEGKMRFQGVVGNAVIINGEMYNIGQKIFGAKILRIGTDYFIGEYKGRQFKKVLR